MDIRVVVASEVRLYREGLQRVLQEAAGITLVGVAACAEEVVALACALLPTVILLDIAIAKSLSIARHFVRAPKIGGVVILGTPETYAEVVGCLPSNVLGFVTQNGSAADLTAAIRAAARGEIRPSRGGPPPSSRLMDVPVALAPSFDDLTMREMEILRLMQEGLSNKTISRRLGIELSTVKNHVHSVLAKLGVHRRAEAISALYRREYSERSWGTAASGEDSLAPAANPAIA